MGIEFLEGKVNSDQVSLERSARVPLLQDIELGKAALIGGVSVWIDIDGLVWLDQLAALYEDSGASTIEGCVRVIKLPEGFVVDVTPSLEDFTDDETGGIDLVPQQFPPYVVEGQLCSRAPVIGLLANHGEVEFFRELVEQKYGYSYPSPVAHPDGLA